jgi:RNA polymerase sigma factor (sigma-70 family)
MSESQETFGDLMRRVREGSEEATHTLLERYGQHILRVVRRKLHRRLRVKFDSQDFVQSVWASFFAQRPAPEQFDGPEALAAFLAEVARNKVAEAFRQRVRTQKRDVERERSLDGSAAFQVARVPGRDPTPSQAAVARERWRRMLAALPDLHQRILRLLRQGHTHADIAAQLGVHEKTVQRLLRRLEREEQADEHTRGTGPGTPARRAE